MFFYDVDSAKEYLLTRGGYEDSGRLSRRNYRSYEEYAKVIKRIAQSVSEKLEIYPSEIHNYLLSHPEAAYYSLKELKAMTYIELSSLRKSLGISKRKTKTSQKVTSTAKAPKETISEAKQVFQSESVSTSAKKIYLSSLQHDIEFAVQPNDDPQILTVEEIIQMYGEDLPSIEYLMNQGIVPISSIEYEEVRRKKLEL